MSTYFRDFNFLSTIFTYTSTHNKFVFNQVWVTGLEPAKNPLDPKSSVLPTELHPYIYIITNIVRFLKSNRIPFGLSYSKKMDTVLSGGRVRPVWRSQDCGPVRKRKGNRTSADGYRSWKIGKDLSYPILLENGLMTAPSLRTLAINAIVATPFYTKSFLRRPGSTPTGSVLSVPPQLRSCRSNKYQW